VVGVGGKTVEKREEKTVEVREEEDRSMMNMMVMVG
jgi:hypothetical protein